MAFRAQYQDFSDTGKHGQQSSHGRLDSVAEESLSAEAAVEVSAVHTAAVNSALPGRSSPAMSEVRQSRRGSYSSVAGASPEPLRVRRNCECGHVFDYRRLGRR